MKDGEMSGSWMDGGIEKWMDGWRMNGCMD